MGSGQVKCNVHMQMSIEDANLGEEPGSHKFSLTTNLDLDYVTNFYVFDICLPIKWTFLGLGERSPLY